MKTELRWTKEAAADLNKIADYLFQKSPTRAAELVRGIYEGPATLLTFVYSGRVGRKEGTRELVLWPLPYIVVYRITGEVIHVVRILHQAQKWP